MNEVKVTVIIGEPQDRSYAPHFVYRKLYTEYAEKLAKKYNHHFWGMGTACDNAARALYAQITGRPDRVKNLILTYTDAEKCFDLFKQFADVWVREFLEGECQ